MTTTAPPPPKDTPSSLGYGTSGRFNLRATAGLVAAVMGMGAAVAIVLAIVLPATSESDVVRYSFDCHISQRAACDRAAQLVRRELAR